MQARLAPFAAALFCAAVVSASARTLIYAGTLIDGVADAPKKEVTVVIDGERIAAVQAGYTAANADDKIIDLKSATVTPGWIDCHVHLDSQNSPTSYTEWTTMNPGDYALRSAFYAKKTLLAGFTSVRNLGDTDNSTLALRKAIAAGWVEGPRVYTAGKAIATTGGHADPTNGRSFELMGDPGVLSLASNGQNPQFTPEELAAIIGTAHEYGLKVAAHAHGTEGMKRAIAAGIDSIEHGTYMTDEIIAMMKEHGTYYVPTISAGRFVADKAKIDGYFPAIVRPKAATIGPLIQATFQRAYQNGVKIAFGTDQGVAPHGDNAMEFVYMVEAGMPPMAAIQSATREAAKLIGVDKDLGTVEPGKYADLVAVPGDVLADIKLTLKPSFVMKSGMVYKQP